MYFPFNADIFPKKDTSKNPGKSFMCWQRKEVHPLTIIALPAVCQSTHVRTWVSLRIITRNLQFAQCNGTLTVRNVPDRKLGIIWATSDMISGFWKTEKPHLWEGSKVIWTLTKSHSKQKSTANQFYALSVKFLTPVCITGHSIIIVSFFFAPKHWII